MVLNCILEKRRMKRLVARRRAASVLLGCLAIYTHHQVLAQTADSGSLPEVRVDANAEAETATSQVIGYRAKNAVTATKTDTPLAETPQSVTVVTRDQMVDQGATNLQDALTYAAGVRSDAYGLDSRSDGFSVRGSDPSVYLDGLQTYSPAGTPPRRVPTPTRWSASRCCAARPACSSARAPPAASSTWSASARSSRRTAKWACSSAPSAASRCRPTSPVR
jgi:hypothetical protein